ncbi:MAG: ElyC/SanA/YdcF family protein [Campylobacterota bacterium]|nr:ElyC/SanA/YdcF family protein [Campylobacterota bacterium]
MDFAFILKKIISSMIMPLPLALILALIGLILLYRDNYKKAKLFLTISFLWVTIIAYNPFSNLLISPLETTYKKLEIIPQDINYILLLGGDMENRGWEVLRLHHNLPNAKIITSGYAGAGDIPEAIINANILYNIGIPKSSIIIHDKPKDTKEETIEVKKLLGKEKFILITSAYHMPRAIALFKKEGLTPIAAPTDFKIKYDDKFLSPPAGNNIKQSEIAWHEYIGLLWSKLRGQI